MTKDNRVVIIRSEPRCGSAWLANFLNYGDVVAVHEGINGCYSLEDYRKKMYEIASENPDELIVDVTTAPPFVVEQLPFPVVKSINTSIFKGKSYLDTRTIVKNICEINLTMDFLGGRFLEWYDFRVTRNLDSIDKEAGLAFIESLKPKSEEPSPVNNFDYEGASLHEILNNLHQRVLNGECSEEMSKMLDHAMYLVETAQGCLGGVGTKKVGGVWIDWSGGECPVPEGTRVEVSFRSGRTNSALTADCWLWSHRNSAGDIIAYRVIG